jgi:hypothetical protein
MLPWPAQKTQPLKMSSIVCSQLFLHKHVSQDFIMHQQCLPAQLFQFYSCHVTLLPHLGCSARAAHRHIAISSSTCEGANFSTVFCHLFPGSLMENLTIRLMTPISRVCPKASLIFLLLLRCSCWFMSCSLIPLLHSSCVCCLSWMSVLWGLHAEHRKHGPVGQWAHAWILLVVYNHSALPWPPSSWLVSVLTSIFSWQASDFGLYFLQAGLNFTFHSILPDPFSSCGLS